MAFKSVLTALNDKHAEFVEVLRDAVAIKSVSASSKLRPEVRRMAEWIRDWIMHEFPASKVCAKSSESITYLFR